MKKMNNRGFMLAETLIVATFLATTLLFLYIQFNKVTKSYDTSFKYNTVNGLYGASNIINYISNDGLSKLKSELSTLDFVDITNCSKEIFNESDYCKSLLDSLSVKTLIFTDKDLPTLASSNSSIEQSLKDFMNYLGSDKAAVYRVIIEYNDNTFASLKMGK